MRKFSFTLAVAAVAVVSGAFSASAEDKWGNLKGRIVLDGELKALPLIVTKGDSTAKDAAVCAAQDVPSEKLVVDKTSPDKEKGIANVFIYMPKKPAAIHPDLKESKDKELKFDQKGCRFLPHAMIVRTDQKVRVMSDDGVAHNTHSYPIRGTAENFIVPPNDRTGSLLTRLTVAEKVPVRIGCDIHSWMDAYFCVVDHPYAAVTDEKGNYEIKNLPVGPHEFIIWHEGCGYVEKKYEVTIKEGDNVQKTLAYKQSQLDKK